MYLRQQDPQQQPGHNLIVVHEKDEEGVSAASDVDGINQGQTLRDTKRWLAAGFHSKNHKTHNFM